MKGTTPAEYEGEEFVGPVLDRGDATGVRVDVEGDPVHPHHRHGHQEQACRDGDADPVGEVLGVAVGMGDQVVSVECDRSQREGRRQSAAAQNEAPDMANRFVENVSELKKKHTMHVYNASHTRVCLVQHSLSKYKQVSNAAFVHAPVGYVTRPGQECKIGLIV